MLCVCLELVHKNKIGYLARENICTAEHIDNVQCINTVHCKNLCVVLQNTMYYPLHLGKEKGISPQWNHFLTKGLHNLMF